MHRAIFEKTDEVQIRLKYGNVGVTLYLYEPKLNLFDNF
jgi:hypothetical protein